MHRGAIVGCFFRRQIRGQDAVSAGVRGFRGETREATLENRIVVAEQNERDIGLLADGTHDVQHASQRCSGAQGAFAGALNRRAIGDRIAEGNAKLDDIGSGIGERQDERRGCGERGIARGDVGDEAHRA